MIVASTINQYTIGNSFQHEEGITRQNPGQGVCLGDHRSPGKVEGEEDQGKRAPIRGGEYTSRWSPNDDGSHLLEPSDHSLEISSVFLPMTSTPHVPLLFSEDKVQDSGLEASRDFDERRVIRSGGRVHIMPSKFESEIRIAVGCE